jgi:4-hydroxy-3-methylbut-2-en-1-yl diphosphate reductase
MTPGLKVNVDPSAGFCFGVAKAVDSAEEAIRQYGHLYCLGSLVHNEQEMQRLKTMGLEVIDRKQLRLLRDTRVLIRAHGEPPETYRIARENNIELIDATCKVVLKLQSRIRNDHGATLEKGGQVVIFGKPGHPEVEGLMGQTCGKAILVSDSSPESLAPIDFSKPIILYCQTTQSLDGYTRLVDAIKERTRISQHGQVDFAPHDTICRQVAGRGPRIEAFAREHDVMVFVSGKESSNGRFLFSLCQQVNPRSHMVSEPDEVKKEWFRAGDRAGVSGATSTPAWLMEKVAEKIQSFTFA